MESYDKHFLHSLELYDKDFLSSWVSKSDQISTTMEFCYLELKLVSFACTMRPKFKLSFFKKRRKIFRETETSLELLFKD